MSTEKLYYRDVRLLEFAAALESQQRIEDRWHVRLDRTAFYPEAGGQPADRGLLNGLPVLAVLQEGDGIVHVLGQALAPGEPGQPVQGRVDAAHRLDSMQQHTGQHIVSAALVRRGAFPTVAIHMGESSTTVEIDAPDISAADLAAVEETANHVIRRNLPVRTRWIGSDEAAGLALRRPPPDRERLRLVEIEGFDLCACGGLHLETTGEVGLVKALGTEKIRGRVRLYWKIGGRAYLDYRDKHDMTVRLGRILSSTDAEIPAQVEMLLARLQEQTRESAALEKRLAAELAVRLAAEAEERGGVRLISAGLQGESQNLARLLSGLLLAEPRRVVCLSNARGDRLDWLAGASEDVELDLAALMKPLLPIIGGRGGGRARFWQGSGDRPEAQAAFHAAWRENTAGLLAPGA